MSDPILLPVLDPGDPRAAQGPEATLAVELRKVLDRLYELSSYDQVQACATAGGIVYRNFPVIIAALERAAAEGGKAEAWDQGRESGWEAAQVAGEVWVTDDDPNPYRSAS